ncbi:hypothetical protein DICPUDRAFT_53563 [Dictyostelium purpureum]|uniref:Pre-mRNA-splicing factor cwc2 n=1 Tax=Dictyostelium purpureum TaxID=5786 RepID=F0ZDH1_DICPU|nr:uncharacterized protein DICPUDRAFT_53563 [Dictyostelium purpureum]EGC37980.1 hypothetical protein DICPUDRAFT_53563 [Dictyostelium purpureum]|eukprot:XP_003285464.1 hypothetical protein DICPUDRAFT_53563 [Dictyostelium purpureum]
MNTNNKKAKTVSNNKTIATKNSDNGFTIGENTIWDLQASLLNRPARKQSTHINSRYEDHDVDTTEYNIWYHRKLGNKNFKDRDISETRCNVLKDCGKTRAGKNAYFCCHFSKGRCVNGADCTFLHRVPTPEDDKRLEITHDIFGRERHKTDRDDMGGVGSFSRDNRTLYIGGIKSNLGGSMEDVVRKHFEEWGKIEYVRVILNRSIAFVRYFYRSNAEFAKEAMADQTLDGGELLNVRWATEDSNPFAKKVDERNVHRVATEVINKRIREMTPDDQSALKFQMTGQYPNTDVQYDKYGQPIQAPNSTPYQIQYRGSQNYEVHPYALQYNKDLEKRQETGNVDGNVAPLGGVGSYYSHDAGHMNKELQQQQYEEYLKSYYQAYGYDYTKLSDEEKQKLQQYYQSYYYGNQTQNKENDEDDDEEEDDENDDENDDEDEEDNEQKKENDSNNENNKNQNNKNQNEKEANTDKEDKEDNEDNE